MHEIRLAIRRLAQRRGATLVSILTLATAIGASAATWSLLSAVLLHPLPVRDPDRLVVAGGLSRIGARGATLQAGILYPYYPLVRDGAVFDSVAAVWMSPLVLPVKSSTSTEATSLMFVGGNSSTCSASTCR